MIVVFVDDLVVGLLLDHFLLILSLIEVVILLLMRSVVVLVVRVGIICVLSTVELIGQRLELFLLVPMPRITGVFLLVTIVLVLVAEPHQGRVVVRLRSDNLIFLVVVVGLTAPVDLVLVLRDLRLVNRGDELVVQVAILVTRLIVGVPVGVLPSDFIPVTLVGFFGDSGVGELVGECLLVALGSSSVLAIVTEGPLDGFE